MDIVDRTILTGNIVTLVMGHHTRVKHFCLMLCSHLDRASKSPV